MRRLTGSVITKCTFLLTAICIHTGSGQRCVATDLVADNSYKYIVSPSFGSYANNINWCRELVTAGEDRVVIITLELVDLEGQSGNCVDFLEILDGGHRHSTSLGRFCQTNSTTVTTTSDEAYIRFRTDRTGTGTGFKLKYRQSEGIEDSIWGSALAGIAGGLSLIWIFMCCCCFCSKKHKVINRDSSSVQPIQNYSTGEQQSSAYRQNGDRVTRPRLWADSCRDSHSSNIYHIVIRANNRRKQEHTISRASIEPTKPPVYEEQDPSSGKPPAYDDIVEEEFSRIISPPPTYREHSQEEVIPVSPPPAYPPSATSGPYL